MYNALSVKAKLGIAFGALTVMVIFISLLSLHEISASNERFSEYVNGIGQRKETASQLLIAGQQRAISARNLVLITALGELKIENDSVTAAHGEVTRLLKELSSTTSSDLNTDEIQERQRLIADIASIESRYGPVALDIVDLATHGQKDAAIQKMNTECLPLLRKLVNSVNTYITYEAKIGEASLQEAQANYTRQRIELLVTCVLSAGIALALGMLIVRSLIKALGAEPALLSAIAQRVAAGDLRSINEARNASAGSVLASLNDMQNNLSKLISEVNSSSTVISNAAEKLSTATEDARIGISQQKQEIDQVATAIHEMAATVQEVARNSEGVAHRASVADQQAQNSERMTREVIKQIEHLANEVSQSVAAMSRLKKESESIGSVLDVIKSVADQTNLLALNAAIEAARAGEAGRGFAVVADEVRGLAQHTQGATHEIETLINNLQKISEETARMMEGCRSLTDKAVIQVSNTGEAVGTITEMITNIQQMMHQIATAAEEQSAVAEEINRSVTRVRDIADRSAAASEQTATSSTTLARLGNTLQEQIQHFQI